MRDSWFHLDLTLMRAATRSMVALRRWFSTRIAPLAKRWDGWQNSSVRTVLSALLVASAYYVGTLIGLSVTFQGSPISPIWPTNAILLVALLLVPTRIWWACLLAVCGAHLLVEVPNGVPLVTAIGLYFTNSSEAVLGAFLVRWLIKSPPWLGSFRRVGVYLACAVIVAPVLTSFADAAVVVLTHWGTNYWASWETRTVSNSLAELTIGPALLLALTEGRAWMRDATRKRSAEAVVLTLAVLLVGITVFGGQVSWAGSTPVLVYAVLPLLLWTAIRFSVGGTTLALLGITVLATWRAAQGNGPFSSYSPVYDVISLQLYLIGISVPMLFLAALIKERQAGLQALQASEERYRNLVESQTEMICRYLPDSTLTFVNEAFCRYYKKSRKQLIGKRFLDLMDDAAREHHERYIETLLAGALASVDEHGITLPDGSTGWQQWVDHTIQDSTGAVVEIQAIGRDITARKRAEEALRASEERYRAVVNNFPHGVVLLFDQHLRHVFVDGQGLPDIGLSHQAIEGKTIWDAFPTDLSAGLAPRYQEALAGQPAAFDLNYAGHTYQTHVLPIRYGASTAGMAVMQDVTQRRRVEMLAELDRTKTAFFSNISHELRTPLTLLLAPAADALADRVAPLLPRQRERLELIQRSAQRLHKLVDTLLTFSRIEAGHIQASYEPTDVAALTADLASAFRSAAERAGLRLIVRCEPPDHVAQPVYVDRDMWEQIVLNLLSNALKFTVAGEIAVTVRAVEDHDTRVELEVRDTGPGIPADELPHVFERFYRARHARARMAEGTGIGLALVYELVRLHHGTVEVTSTPGEGSIFTVAIPTGYAHLPADRIVRREDPSDLPVQAVRAGRTADAALLADGLQPRLPQPPRAPVLPSPSTTAARDGHAPDAFAQSQPDGLPVQHAHGAHVEAPAARTARPTILVADDNADLRAYLVRLLSERWDVQEVADGLSALAAAQSEPPDLVLTDVIMPGLDGFALVAALREKPQTQAVPVILLSARAGDEATVEGLEAGANDYLIKPFSSRELLARVQTHLELARVRKESAARAAQLDAIFEAMADGVLVQDVDRCTMRANRAYRDLLQRHLELLGLHVELDTLVHSPTEREHYITIRDEHGHVFTRQEWPTERALRGETLTGANAVDEYTQGPDGHILQVNVSAAPIRAGGGEIIGAVAVLRDVTEHRQLERQVAEQERLFRTLVENSPDIIIRFDRHLRHLYVSPASQRILGIPPDARLGKTYAELGLPKDVFAPWEQALRTVFATGEPYMFESGYHAYGLPPQVSRVRYVPELAADGSVESVLGITTDITDLKQAEEALQAATAAAEAAQRQEEQRRREAERREQIAGSLRDVLTILNSDRQVTKILDYIARQAGWLLSSDAAAIYMTASHAEGGESATRTTTDIDRSFGTLALQAAFGLPPALTSRQRKNRLRVGDAAVRHAMATRRPVMVRALPAAAARSMRANQQSAGESEEQIELGKQTGDDTSDYIDVQDELLPAPYRALLAIPIVAQGRVYGSLLLLYTAPHRFSADEVALAMAYGDQVALAVANARLQDHIERAAAENERNRLARELHDTVTQEIFTASVLAESIPQVWEHHRAEAEASLRQVHRLTRGALAALRALLLELRPTVLEHMELADLLRQLGEVMSTRCGIPIMIAIADDCPPVPSATKVAFYRIAQEALTNAAKYAHAQNIAVRLRYVASKEAVQLEVQDDGQGFETRTVPAGHFGLSMMRERARAAGAALRITSRPERGTRVAIRWIQPGREASTHDERTTGAASVAEVAPHLD